MIAPENGVGKRGSRTDAIQKAASHGTAGSGGALPYAAQIQRRFGGYDLSNVQAHAGGAASHATRAMGADACASGNHVVLGDSGTDLHTVAHDAAHVVQQRQGVSLSGIVGRAGDPYEQHADAVADLVVQGKSAEGLLGQMAAGCRQTRRRKVDCTCTSTFDKGAVLKTIAVPSMLLVLALGKPLKASGESAPPSAEPGIMDARNNASFDTALAVLRGRENIADTSAAMASILYAGRCKSGDPHGIGRVVPAACRVFRDQLSKRGTERATICLGGLATMEAVQFLPRSGMKIVRRAQPNSLSTTSITPMCARQRSDFC